MRIGHERPSVCASIAGYEEDPKRRADRDGGDSQRRLGCHRVWRRQGAQHRGRARGQDVRETLQGAACGHVAMHPSLVLCQFSSAFVACVGDVCMGTLPRQVLACGDHSICMTVHCLSASACLRRPRHLYDRPLSIVDWDLKASAALHAATALAQQSAIHYFTYHIMGYEYAAKMLLARPCACDRRMHASLNGGCHSLMSVS